MRGAWPPVWPRRRCRRAGGAPGGASPWRRWHCSWQCACATFSFPSVTPALPRRADVALAVDRFAYGIAVLAGAADGCWRAAGAPGARRVFAPVSRFLHGGARDLRRRRRLSAGAVGRRLELARGGAGPGRERRGGRSWRGFRRPARAGAPYAIERQIGRRRGRPALSRQPGIAMSRSAAARRPELADLHCRRRRRVRSVQVRALRRHDVSTVVMVGSTAPMRPPNHAAIAPRSSAMALSSAPRETAVVAVCAAAVACCFASSTVCRYCCS